MRPLTGRGRERSLLESIPFIRKNGIEMSFVVEVLKKSTEEVLHVGEFDAIFAVQLLDQSLEHALLGLIKLELSGQRTDEGVLRGWLATVLFAFRIATSISRWCGIRKSPRLPLPAVIARGRASMNWRRSRSIW